MNEQQQIEQVALQLIGLAFGIQTDNEQEFTQKVQQGLSQIPKEKLETFKTKAVTYAKGVVSGQIKKDQLPEVVKDLQVEAGLQSPLMAKLGAKLAYINKLNNKR